MPVLFAVAILEDQHHQTDDLQVIRGDEILQKEDALFLQSQQLLPRLPFSNIDLLIVDELGKEISGTGMDTNVIGRGVFGFISSLRPQGSPEIHISRIFVRDLTPATNGNAIGIGLAAVGLLNPLLAAFIHVASELTFILNSTRLLPRQENKASSHQQVLAQA